jgi:hypothetical protein
MLLNVSERIAIKAGCALVSGVAKVYDPTILGPFDHIAAGVAPMENIRVWSPIWIYGGKQHWTSYFAQEIEWPTFLCTQKGNVVVLP